MTPDPVPALQALRTHYVAQVEECARQIDRLRQQLGHVDALIELESKTVGSGGTPPRREPYADLSLDDAIGQILNDNDGVAVHVDAIAFELYGPLLSATLHHTKDDLLEVLRVGVRVGRWFHVEGGFYSSDRLDGDDAADGADSQGDPETNGRVAAEVNRTKPKLRAANLKNLRKPQYRNKSLAEAIESVLGAAPSKAHSISDLLNETYPPHVLAELEPQARHSLHGTLAKGRTSDRWTTPPGARGLYTASPSSNPEV